MKYIKKFENEDHKYKEGDYVLIDTNQITIDVDDFQRAFGVNDRYVPVYIFEYHPNNIYCYYVRGFDFDASVDSHSTSQTYISEDEVSRLLTPDEIDDFNAKKLAIKFNV